MQPWVDKKKPPVGSAFSGAFAKLGRKELMSLSNMTIGQRIAELRKQNGLSQEALGEALGVTRQSISKWESDAALPEIEKLVAMSRLFQISVGALLGVEETPGAEEAPAKGQGEDELSEAQLRMIEEIVARYTEALRAEYAKTRPKDNAGGEQPKGKPSQNPKHKKRVILACAFAVGLLAAMVLNLFSRLEQMDNNYRNLSYAINNVSDDVNRQINGIAYQVESILNEQNALAADSDVSVISVNAKEQTVTLRASVVPKTYEEGMQVEFLAEVDAANAGSEGGVMRARGELQEDARFCAELTCPLTNEGITVSAVFLRGDVRETQVLDMVDYIYNATMPQLNISSFGEWKEAKAGEPFALLDVDATVNYWAGEDVYPVVPEKPYFTRIRVGLFVNRSLVVWAEPREGSFQPTPTTGMSAHAWESVEMMPTVQEGHAWYAFPEGYTVTFEEGDAVCIAAVAEDQFGNEYLFRDATLMLASSAGDDGWVQDESSIKEGVGSTEGWVY